MLSEINERLIKVKGQVRSARRLERMLCESKESYDREKSKLEKLTRIFESEKSDVEKLEGYGLTALFHSILGTKEDRLLKEKQELLAAKLKYDECLLAVADANEEISSLKQQLLPLKNIDIKHHRLINEKEEALLREPDGKTEVLLALAEKLGDLRIDEKELREAIAAGGEVTKALKKVASALDSASNWGTFDLIGGGLMATMVKHSKIDAAKVNAHSVQRKIRIFKKELSDVGECLNLTLEIDGFSKFADYFFDGLIADWLVQTKIHRASSACNRAGQSIRFAIEQCRHRLAEIKKEIAITGQSRLDLIENL